MILVIQKDGGVEFQLDDSGACELLDLLLYLRDEPPKFTTTIDTDAPDGKPTLRFTRLPEWQK